MAKFDYSNDGGPDIETIRSIAAEMADVDKPIPPTEAERLEHEQFLAARRERDRQQQLQYEQRQAELAEAERIESGRRAQIERAERNRRLQEQTREQSARQMRDRQLSDLHAHALEQRQFRTAALRSQAHANARQRLKAVLFPPEPPSLPEPPEIDPDPIGSYFGEPGFSVELWSKRKRNRSWW